MIKLVPRRARFEDATDTLVGVFIDLSALAPSIRNSHDITDALELATSIVISTTHASPRFVDAEARVYGGFFAHDGTATSHYSFLLRAMGSASGLHDNTRIRYNAATSIACSPQAKIIGTFRDGRQRMVDQMLANDLHFLAPQYDEVIIIADDEDYFPAVLSASRLTSTRLHWVRQRPVGRNDAHLAKTNVRLATSHAWR